MYANFGRASFPLTSVAMLWVLSGCSEQTASPDGEVVSGSAALTASDTTASTVQKTVRLNADNSVAIQTLPNAKCVLHSACTSAPDEGLTLLADDAGLVSFRYS